MVLSGRLFPRISIRGFIEASGLQKSLFLLANFREFLFATLLKRRRQKAGRVHREYFREFLFAALLKHSR